MAWKLHRLFLQIQSMKFVLTYRELTRAGKSLASQRGLAPVCLVVRLSCKNRKKAHVYKRSKVVDYVRVYSRFAEMAESEGGRWSLVGAS